MRVKLVHLDTLDVSITFSDAQGRYDFNDLLPGTYLLKATKPGLDPGPAREAILQVAESVNVRLRLRPLTE